jgi:C-terminal processing protease CtpA/Prc
VETAGRLILGSGFKVGHGYMLIMPKAQYITWQGHRFEGAGVKPEISVSWSVESFVAGDDNQLQRALDHFRRGEVVLWRHQRQAKFVSKSNRVSRP